METAEEIVQFVLDNDLCVLATSLDDMPLASLMAYLAEEDLRYLYMATPRQTHKWRNINRNPNLAVLIDDRETALSVDRGSTRAVTIGGVHVPVDEQEDKADILRRLAARHDHLRDFLALPEMEVIRLEPRWFQLLHGAQSVRYVWARE